MKNTHTILKVVLMVAVGLAAAYLLLFVAMYACCTIPDAIGPLLHRKKFDAAEWRRQGNDLTNEKWGPRQSMVDDLIKSRVLLGRTPGEVSDLIGPHIDAGWARSMSNELHYYIGPERGGFGIDNERLRLVIDPSGRVEQVFLFKT